MQSGSTPKMSNKLSNSFASTCMAKLYLQSDSADIHFVFPNDDKGEEVPAHKLLLGAASPVFKVMMNGDWLEKKIVKITDFHACAFKELLQFIYLPEVTLTIGNVEEVVRLADKYDMLDCFDTCADQLEANLTTENMVWGYQLAITLNNEQLMKFCENRIQIHTEEIIRSEMFLHCSREVIGHILKLDTLQCNEVELFNACIEWAKVACLKHELDESNSENLKNQLGPCFYAFRFGAMDGEGIGDILLNKVIEGMFTKSELADIMRSKCSKRPKLELFNHQPRLKPLYKWDAENELVCKRSFLDSTIYRVQSRESTWFSASEFVLLGEMSFVPTQRSHGTFGDQAVLNFDIEILEHDNVNNFASDAPTKLHYTKSNVKGSYSLVLDTPILVRPHKMYEIRLLPTTGFSSNYSHNLSWGDPVTQLNDKITIKFHQNPSENDSTRRGLVSTLYFNCI